MKWIFKILFFISLILSEGKVVGQTSFYFQDFEATSGWTLSPAISGNGNYWSFAGGLTSDHAYSGDGALIIADYWEGSWYVDYDGYAGHSDYSRTARRTFDFSTIPSGSDIKFSYYIRCVGESGFDDLRVRVNDGGGWVVLDGPLTGIATWANRTIDLSAYAEEASVTVSFEWRNDGSVQNQPAARIDDISIEYTTSCTAPANQATSFNSSNIALNSMDISWTRGTPDGGNEVIVVVRAGGAVNANPVNGATAYTANAAFSSGTEIGTGNYVVYKGTGTSFSLTGLDDDETYHYAIYEYNIDAGDNCYNLTPLTGSATTPSCAGLASASAASVSTCDATVTLSLSDYSAGSFQWQWSPDNSTWYNISGATTDSEVSPYVTRATTYYRVLMSGGCTSASNVVTVTSSSASSCYFWEGRTSTAFATGSNWSGGSTPDWSTDHTYIPKGTPTCVFANGNDYDVGNFYLQEGSTLDYQHNSLTGTLWIHGNAVLNGTISYSSDAQGYIAMRGTTKTLTVGANADLSEMRIQISDAGSITLSSDVEFHEFLIYNSGTFNVGSNTLKTKFFGVSNTGSASNYFNLNSGTLEIGGGTAFDKSGAHLTGKTNPHFEHGNINLGTGLVFYNSGDFSAAANQTVKSRTYPNLKIRTNNGYTVAVGNTGTTTTVTNVFTVENPGAAGGVVELDDDLYVNGTVNIGVTGNGLKLYTDWGFIQRSTGTGTTVFNMGNNDAHQIEIDWSWDSGVKSPFGLGASGAEIPLVFYGTVNYMRSGTGFQNVTAGSYKNLILSGLGSGTLGFIGNTSVNGDLTLSKTAGIVDFRTYEISLKGNLINNFSGTTQEPSTSDFVLNGTSTQSIEGSASTNFYNLKIDNNTNVTIERSASVKNEVVFTDGHFITAYTKYLIFETGATESGAKASSHVNGPVQKLTNSTTAFKFPVGDGTAYRPIQIEPASGDATTWTAKYNNVAYGTLGVRPPLAVVSDVEYWDLDRTGTANGTVTLWWDENSTVNTSDLSELRVAHFDSGDNLWEDAGNSATTGDATAGSISSTVGWSTYSPFTIGSPEGSALPVTLTHFSINCKDENRTVLTWQTESEQNSNYFDIEKSVDGISWEVVGNVQAQGNSNSTHDYLWTDYSPYRGGVSYYRLRQVDFDGVYEIFGPVSSRCFGNKHNVLDVYPNPTDGNITMSYSWFNGEVGAALKLTDATGRLVQVQTVSLINGMNYYGFDLSSHAKGMYFITIEMEGEGINFARVVKQ
jgi:hypothetical protein